MIEVSVHDWCATVEVEDFSALSRHDGAFARELCTRLVEVSDADDVKAIVLRARSTDFAPQAGPPPHTSVPQILTDWHRDFAASSALYQVLCFSKKVVVTQVAGACFGAGSLLVLCSDLTLATEGAQFGSPFTDLPEANFVLAALTMRLNRAKSWMLSGSTISAQNALSCGLVNQVVPDDALADATADVVRNVTAMPLDGITMSKMLLQAVLDGHGVGREFDLADHYAIHKLALPATSAT